LGTPKESILLAEAFHQLLRWPAVYDLVQRAVGARGIQQRLAGHVNALPGASWVLDIGGGTGTLGSALDSRSDYVCLDLDAARLRSFQHRHLHARCLVADAAQVPIATGKVGTVVCSAVSHHLDDELFGSMIREARRVLRADGRLVFMDAVWAPRRWCGRVLWRYDQGSHPRTAATLRLALARYFDITAWEEFAVLHRYVVAVAAPRRESHGVSVDAN
jgi:SAM-dependent methyltransferase